MKRIIPLALILVSASCAESMAPLTQDVGHEDIQLLAAKKGGGGPPGGDSGDPASHPLRHAPTAPPLETYQVSLWAVDGKSDFVEVGYAGIPDRFLRFTVGNSSLKTWPDGSPIATGDSVLITITLDPVDFTVTFAPAGLGFSKRDQPVLRMWYTEADPDIDRDGDVDAVDEALLETGISFFYVDTQWKKLWSANNPNVGHIDTKVPHFSGYAVSW